MLDRLIRAALRPALTGLLFSLGLTDTVVGAETGRVTCEQGIDLERTAGRAFDLRDNPKFSRRHAQATQGEPDWIRTLNGPSAFNRLYRSHPPILVFHACKTGDCGKHRLYGAVDGTRYGLVIMTGDRRRERGEVTPRAQAAIACAWQEDRRIAQEVFQSIRER